MTVDKSRDQRGTNSISNESILKVSKEIAIKFIEMGRITPTTFDEAFRNIHATIRETVEEKQP